MADYYLDSSALLKRYVAEVGTAWLTSLIRPPGTVVFVSLVTPVEMVAAVTRRARNRSVSAADARAACQAIEEDVLTEYSLVQLTRGVVAQAVRLAVMHGLRGYDAIQLASALEANDRLVSSGLAPLTFICADQELNTVASAEGLTVDDPNNHP